MRTRNTSCTRAQSLVQTTSTEQFQLMRLARHGLHLSILHGEVFPSKYCNQGKNPSTLTVLHMVTRTMMMLMLIFFEGLHHLVSCVYRRPLLSTFFRLPSQQLVLEINLWSTGTENQHKNAIKSTNITIGQILTSLSRGRLICSIGMLLTLFDPPYFEPFQTQGGGADLPPSFFLNSQKSLIYDLV